MSALVIVEVHARAEAVVNGFKKVTDQQARDVVRLVAEINAKDAVIANLEKKVMGLELILAGYRKPETEAHCTSSDTYGKFPYSAKVEEAFSDIFGGGLFGKKSH